MTKLKLADNELESLRERLKAAIQVDIITGCWIWQHSTKNGYGQLTVHNRNVYAHQLSYEVFVGPIPEGMDVCHKCDVRRCIYPEHFFPGTRKQNLADMRKKGRHSDPPKHFGAKNSNVILTDSQVIEIRQLLTDGIKQRTIAARFNISQTSVWRYKHGIVRREAFNESSSR